MATTIAPPAFAEGDVVRFTHGTVLFEVTQIDAVDGMVRVWPVDRDDHRTGQWAHADQLTKVEIDADEAGRARGTHRANGYGYCSECRIALTKVADEPICDGTYYEVI